MSTNITNLDLVDLRIYPNPSNNVFNIEFSSLVSQDLDIRIFNIIGEEIVREALQQFAGKYVQQINLASNAKGVYFLEIATDKGIINKKLILH